MRQYLAPALAAFLLVLVPAVHAQQAATDYTEFNLDELVAMDLVYGASQYAQKVVDAPASVTVITGDEIRTFGSRTLGDVLATVPGFYVSYDRSYEYVGVRGFGRPGDYNARVLVLMDGHPINDLIYNQAPVGADSPLDLEGVERIEIIRGPGGALYGNGAFFAVVNIVTMDGGDLGGGELSAEAGSHGRYGGRGAWGGAIGGEGSVHVAVSGFNADGEDLYWPEFDDPATNDGVFENGDGESVLRLSGRARRGGFTVAAGYNERTKHVPTAEWDMIFNDDGAKVFDSRFTAAAGWEGSLGDRSALRARLSYDRSLYRGDYPYDYADPGDPLDRVVSQDIAEGRWITGSLHLESRVGARHRLLIGGDVRKALRAHQWSADPTDVHLDIDERVDNAGLFLQDEIRLGDGLSAFAAVRHDSYSSFGGHTTPRLGIVARPARGTTLKLLYGQAFRAPNAYEMHYADGMTQKGNPGLEPEHIRTVELVWEQALSPRVTASLSLYRNAIHDLIDQVVDPADSLITFANIGEVETTGLEAALDGRLLAGLHGRAGYSLQRSEDEKTGVTLTNSPQQILQASLATPWWRGLAAAGLEVRHVSRRKTLDGAYVEAYTVADLTLRIAPGVAGLHVDVAVRNLLDEAYADPGAEHQRQDAIAREGRTFGLRATVTW